MILYVLLASLTFSVLLAFGYSAQRIIRRFSFFRDEVNDFSLDELFFTGFLVLSACAGIISIFLPVGFYMLGAAIMLAALMVYIFKEGILELLTLAVRRFSNFNRAELILLFSVLLFILITVVQSITLGDTQTYHAQNIQWIRKYAVVPGLGNFHGRFAFNSMFFVISALFTFEYKEYVIYPLNTVCYIVLIIRLIRNFRKESKPGSVWKSLFYALLFLLTFLIILPDLNSPSPDIICSILVIYLLISILEKYWEKKEFNNSDILLLTLIVISTISFKLSSAFLIVLLFLFLGRDILKRFLLISLVCILILSPFLVRNYYLSGYLVYPFPSIDVFNVDWKIPLEDVAEMKSLVQGWAKMWYLPPIEVQKMSFYQWLVPWSRSLNLLDWFIMGGNLLSLITLFYMIVKRDFGIAKIQLVILINLFFWLIMAPDKRFAYGFLFVGFALTGAIIIKILEATLLKRWINYSGYVLICLLIVIVLKRSHFPVELIQNPSRFIIPASFGKADIREYNSGFLYRVETGAGCLNDPLPCTNQPLTNVVLRGNGLKEGFKVVYPDSK